MVCTASCLLSVLRAALSKFFFVPSLSLSLSHPSHRGPWHEKKSVIRGTKKSHTRLMLYDLVFLTVYIIYACLSVIKIDNPVLRNNQREQKFLIDMIFFKN